ncbi:MAG: hypothetical protein DRI86_14450 [Bacteroidetes bacterium]|nr:MAG: hypothetical protein DRI86_14450 [Bacteroidota bacterium]
MNNLRNILLIVFVIGLSQSLLAQNKIVNADFVNTGFNEFCKSITKQSGYKIYYKSKYLGGRNVNMHINNITALQAVKKAVDTNLYQVVFWNSNIIITKDKSIPTKVVTYSFEIPIVKNDTVNIKEEYYKTTKAGVLKKIIVGKKGAANINSEVTIKAKVIDAETGAVIPGATIYLESLKKGAVADKLGIATVAVKPGKYTVSVMFMSMKTQKYRLIVYSAGSFDVGLYKESFELSSIDIYGDRQMSMLNRDPGIEKVSGKTLKTIPVMVGEPDIIKASTMLPGIVSVGEGTSGLNVRGGSSDQNAFYLNSIPIFNTSHMLGFFPAFNADLIRDFTIYKGYIPSNYGGKLSSVFDIKTRKGNRREFSLHGGVSPMAANMVASVPIIPDTLSFIVSGRKSYSDWILHKVDDKNINSSSVEFSDFSFGVYYDLPKTHISVFGYHSNDLFAFSDVNEYRYSNDGLSFKVGQNYSEKLRATYTVVGSQYKFGTKDFVEPTKSYEHDYNIVQNEFKAEFNYTINSNHQIEAGFHSVYYGLNRGEVKPLGSESILKLVDLKKEKGIENSLFVNDVISPYQWLELNLGFRYSMYNALGPKTVYKYVNDKPQDILGISDTISYGNNEIISTHHFPEFRFAANIIASKKSNIKASFTQMHQSLFMLNTTATVSPSSQWKLADYYLNPSKSNQYSLGYFRDFTRYGFELSVEGFYKSTKDYTEFRDGAEFLSSNKVELAVLQGDQYSYGIETMLRRKGEYKFTGWIAYTYSKSIVHIFGDEKWENVNNGLPYPSSYDIPHSLNVFLNIKLSKRVNFSTTLNYQTGRPITFPISKYFINSIAFLDYSDRNAYRIPYYFRMDASLTVEGNLKRNKFIHSSFVLSIYNLTGRDNPYSVYFLARYGKVTAHQYSVIAIPVVTATWIFKLGNFDAN